MAKLDTLTDNFNDNSLHSKWFEYESGTTLVSETGGRLQVALPASAGATDYGGIENDNATFDFSSSYALVKIQQAVSASTNANQSLVVYEAAYGSLVNSVRWFIEAGTLYAQKYVSSVKTNIGTLSFDINVHKWWRLREESGTTYWDTSADGINWTNRFSNTTGIAATAMNINLECSCYQAETNPGTGIFDNFNLVTKEVLPTGIASSENFGTGQIGMAVTVSGAGDIASGEAFGIPAIGGPREIAPTGIDEGAFGVPTINTTPLSSTDFEETDKPTTATTRPTKPTTDTEQVDKPATSYSDEVL